jgi:hypothetical protein
MITGPSQECSLASGARSACDTKPGVGAGDKWRGQRGIELLHWQHFGRHPCDAGPARTPAKTL